MRNPSTCDPNQIIQRKFDEAQDADRVVIVGGEGLNISASIDSKELGEAIASNIKLEPSSSQQVQIIEVPRIIKEIEIKEIQIPTIIKETEYKEIEKPVIVLQKEIEYKEVQVPVITQEVKVIEIYRDRFSTLEKILLASQTLAMIFVAISYLLKGK